jgi:hypothetical protein
MKKYRKAALVFGIMSLALLAVNMAPGALAAGLISSGDQPSLIAQQTGGEGDIREFAKKILNFVLGFLGFIAVAYIIYGGFLYVMDGGAEENAKKGKTIIMQAAIGILIILASFAIVNTILKAPSGVSGGTTTSTSSGL